MISKFIPRLKKVFLIGTVFFVSQLNAQSKSERLDSLLTTLYKSNQFSGTVLLAENGKVIYSKSFGWANYKYKDTLKTNTSMPIASITKQFTGMAIMMLKEKGLLNYDDKIRTFLPEVKQEGVTIRHLLNHTSGLDFNSSGSSFDYFAKNALSKDGIKIIDKELLLKCYAQEIPKPIFSPPGKMHRYSNGGYTLLASIIERVSGLSYWEFMQKNIFDPLEMSNTFVLRPAIMKEKKIAYSYKPSLIKGIKRVTPYYDPESPEEFCVLLDGDKHIYSTAVDMFKWDQALYSEKLVSKETLKDAFTPGKLNDGTRVNYGFGWDLSEGKDSSTVGHTGSIENYCTAFQRRTHSQSTIILLLNSHPHNLFPLWTGMSNVLKSEPFLTQHSIYYYLLGGYYIPYAFPKKTLSEKLTYRRFKNQVEIKN